MAQDNAPSLVLRTDNLHPDRPIQHLFIHTPRATDLESVLDALSILDRADLTSGGPAGPLRLAEGGDVRDAVLVSSGARVSYAVDQPAALVSFAVHLSGSTGATIRAWQETSAGATAIASTQVTGAGWHNLSLRWSPPIAPA